MIYISLYLGMSVGNLDAMEEDSDKKKTYDR
jgi:hypothetical protein